ncbi:MAG: trp operon repressor [Thermoanaerobaculia bacterium]|nr:trp operon repressor [Thermoanaerobaculia bacterium]
MRTCHPPRGGGSGVAIGRVVEPSALPALLRATHLLGLALGSALGKLRESGVTVAQVFAKAEEQALLLRMTRETATILAERWGKVPDRHRPHYAPEQRFRILRIRTFLGLSQRETAEMFRVSTETIGRWDLEATDACKGSRATTSARLVLRRRALAQAP